MGVAVANPVRHGQRPAVKAFLQVGRRLFAPGFRQAFGVGAKVAIGIARIGCGDLLFRLWILGKERPRGLPDSISYDLRHAMSGQHQKAGLAADAINRGGQFGALATTCALERRQIKGREHTLAFQHVTP